MSTRDPSDPPLQYRIYWNGGGGGPIDYTVPIATTTELSWATSSLSTPGLYAFGVRAFDPSTNLEESNSDVTVTVRLDASWADRTGVPETPRMVTMHALAGGGCRVDWVYHAPRSARRPLEFRVTLGTAASSAEVARVPFVEGLIGYSATVPGPLAHGSYWAEVQGIGDRGPGSPSSRAEASLGVSGEPLSMEAVTVRVS